MDAAAANNVIVLWWWARQQVVPRRNMRGRNRVLWTRQFLTRRAERSQYWTLYQNLTDGDFYLNLFTFYVSSQFISFFGVALLFSTIKSLSFCSNFLQFWIVTRIRGGMCNHQAKCCPNFGLLPALAVECGIIRESAAQIFDCYPHQRCNVRSLGEVLPKFSIVTRISGGMSDHQGKCCPNLKSIFIKLLNISVISSKQRWSLKCLDEVL